MARACACFALTSLSIFSSESPYHASPLIVEANWWAMRLHSVFIFDPFHVGTIRNLSGLRTNRGKSDYFLSIAFTPAARFSSPKVHLRRIDRKTSLQQSGWSAGQSTSGKLRTQPLIF